jgi:thioredoxin 1
MNRYLLFQLLMMLFSPLFSQGKKYVDLSSEEFSKKIKSDQAILLDVRTQTEFLNGYIKGAGQLNYYNLCFKKKLLLLPKDQPVYLYCNTGYRSKRAAQILVKNGYKQVFNLENGIMEWNLNNFPVIVDPNAPPNSENKMEAEEYYALIKSGKRVFIDFYAPWCAPCRKMMPMIDGLKKEYKGKVTVVKINADASKKLVKELKLRSVPHFRYYKSGEKLFEHNGVLDKKQIVALFEK